MNVHEMHDKPSLLRIPCAASEVCEPYGFHKHQCPSCGYVWKHADTLADEVSERDNRLAHSCPACGTMQGWKLLPESDSQVFVIFVV